MRVMKIGEVIAEPGTKNTGFLNVSINPDGSRLDIPLIIVNGVEKGPTLEVDACVHGDEYEGTEAIMRLGQKLDPKELSGTFIGVSVVNVPAFEARSRINPNDYNSLNMNRVFPGREKNSYVTEKIAFTFFNYVISKADYVITFHSGGNWLNCYNLVYQSSDWGEELGEKSRELAKIFGLEVLLEYKGGWPGSLIEATAKKGIPTIMPEVGGGDISHREYYVNENITGVTNVMKHLGMLKGKPELPAKQIFLTGSETILSQYGGLWVPQTKVRQKVAKGDIIGKVVNPFFGDEVDQIEAPFDGLVWLIWTSPLIHAGDLACAVGKVT